MIGQGGPNASCAPRARVVQASRWLCALAWLMALAVAVPSRANAADTTLELRIAWGGGAEHLWRGSIRLSQGTLSGLQALGIEADEPGSIWLGHDGIEIRSRSLRAYDGVDVLVTASLDAKLIVSLANDVDEAGKTFEVPLRDVAYQSQRNTLDTNDNRLLVSRSPGDRLRVSFTRENLVFSPGEKFQFELAAHLLEPSGTQVRYRAQIVSVPGGQQVWTQEYESGDEGTATSIEIRVPELEGVYDLTLAAVPPRSRTRLPVKRAAISERKVQFVVLDNRAPAEGTSAALTRVLEINPMNPKWSERLAGLPALGAFRREPLGNGQSAPWEHPTLGTLVQLGPGGVSPDISWEAYPLPLSRPGQPHVLEIEYPSDVPQAMGISIIEPNAAGAVMPIGLDSGVYVSEEDAYVASEKPGHAPILAKHRVVFWPRTKTPLLLITNRRDASRAVYGKITVWSSPHQQFAVLPLGRGESSGVLPPAFPASPRPARLWAGYLDRPLFVENFSAPEALDALSHRSLDDWNTIYQGAQRLARYLKHVGYNGLMMSAMADGSTIYPSRVVEPTPRYDTGVFFSTGQDPLRKDSLELLFRIFDREELTLIPALDFASPLPELEAIKRSGGAEAVGIEWIGPGGASLAAGRAPRQGLAPYYNLLHERVQEAMFRAAREVIGRYADHVSFGGIGLQLSHEGYAQLPGDTWGYDDHTVARFERDTGTTVPTAGRDPFEARAKFFSGPGREAWLAWRTGVVAEFHRRLENEIHTRRPGAKLYLAGGTMLENRQTQSRLRPALLKRARLDDALAELGLRTPAYRDQDGIVLLRPQHLRPPSGPLSAQASDLEMNLAPEMDRLFAVSPTTGSLFYHEPQKARLASFDGKSPFGANNTYAWLVSQFSPGGDRNRRRFVHSLATLDSQAMFDGGWLLSLGQEESLKEILSVYRQLPTGRFETVAGEFQPTMRTLSRDSHTYVYAVNDSPWEVSVTVALDVPRDCAMERLGESRGIGPLERVGAETTCRITLKPYDLVAARLSAPDVRVRNPVVTVPDYVRQGLERRIKDLSARVAALGNPQPLGVLENPSFELPKQGEGIAGWAVAAGSGSTAVLDTGEKHNGNQSLKLNSRGQSVTIASAPFRAPTTGRVSVEFYLRTSSKTQPTLRLSLDGSMRDSRYNPYGMIKTAAPNSAAGEWVRYAFPVDDVPSEGLSELSVRLELVSAGEVWLDDVQVFDLSFSEAERVELSKLVAVAYSKLNRGQLADCTRLLEGYWPQFLVSNVPLTQTSTPLAQRQKASAGGPTPPPKKPTVLDNLRGYLPRMPQR